MHQICDNMLTQVHLFLHDCTKNVHNWAMKTMKGWATLNELLVFACDSGHLHKSQFIYLSNLSK